jgi:signal transduction histidine kinase
LGQPEQAEKFLQRITEEVHTSSQAMDDIIWSVNSQNDSLEETLMRMRRFTAELFDGSDKEYHLQLDESIRGRKLNMEQRRDAFLMFKEILNNIHKHAEADKIWITVKLADNNLILRVKDNGKGFEESKLSHRNGLKNTYKRAMKWNGKANIRSKEGSGTEIDILLPISG